MEAEEIIAMVDAIPGVRNVKSELAVIEPVGQHPSVAIPTGVDDHGLADHQR